MCCCDPCCSVSLGSVNPWVVVPCVVSPSSGSLCVVVILVAGSVTPLPVSIPRCSSSPVMSLAVCLAPCTIVPCAACPGSVNPFVIAPYVVSLASCVVSLASCVISFAPFVVYVPPPRCCYSLCFCCCPLCRRSLVLSSLVLSSLVLSSLVLFPWRYFPAIVTPLASFPCRYCFCCCHCFCGDWELRPSTSHAPRRSFGVDGG